MSRRGFTLIEILVVLAVISILSGVLLPLFSKAREQARRSVCASNFRHLGLAFQQYTQDNNGTYPPVYNIRAMGWAGRVYPYAKNAEVFTCPDDTTASVSSGGKKAVACSYALNSNFLPQEAFSISGGVPVVFPGYHNGMPLSVLDAPADTVELSEVSGAPVVVSEIDEATSNNTQVPPGGFSSPAGDGVVGFDSFCSGGWAFGPGNPGVTCAPYASGTHLAAGEGGTFGPPRHFDGANYLAADGHVKFLRPAQVSVGPNGDPNKPESAIIPLQAAGTRSMHLSSKAPVTLTYNVN